ncbi:MAG: four helix bundle protein [Chitinophagaceae bacterium]|nr:four helix bundle protein [Chitinophagaceae bacterium]MBL0273691.1 four helix bundle protein [Chitinophagaceae bacterium]
MSTIKNFEDLKVWQKSRILCQQIFEIIEEKNFSKDYKLKDQINGSSGSVMDNIAEGFGRQGNNEFINFLTISNGSVMEVKSQLYRALDRKYIIRQKFDELSLLIEEISKMIFGLIAYLGKSDFRGQKFKAREK